MTENYATAETPSARTTSELGPVRSLRGYVVAVAAAVSVERLGVASVALFAAYLALVVPADLALLLVATLAAVALTAMMPLAAVGAVARLVD